jgi:hypothetical protein
MSGNDNDASERTDDGVAGPGDGEESHERGTTHGEEDADSGEGADHTGRERASTGEGLAGLDDLEGWRVEGSAARVHYSGATDRYSIEYYDPSGCVLYWKVPPEDAGEVAVPVGRNTVPTPLRERIREDLAAAGIDPEVEQRTL